MRDKKTEAEVKSKKAKVRGGRRRQIFTSPNFHIFKSKFSHLQIVESLNLLPSTHHKT